MMKRAYSASGALAIAGILSFLLAQCTTGGPDGSPAPTPVATETTLGAEPTSTVDAAQPTDARPTTTQAPRTTSTTAAPTTTTEPTVAPEAPTTTAAPATNPEPKPPVTESLSTEPPSTPAPTAAPTTAPPETSAPTTAAPTTEPPATQAPATTAAPPTTAAPEPPATHAPTAPPATEAPTPSPNPSASPSPDVIALTNQQRQAAGLATLSTNGVLTSAAAQHSQDQAGRNSMGHGGSDGSDVGARISANGGSFGTWGENVAAGYSSASGVVDGWMNSQGHRDNILNPSMTEIGVAVAIAADGTPYWTMVLAG